MSAAARREAAIEIGRGEVVPLLQRMLGFDTEADSHLATPREDAAHQEFVADYLRELGAEVELFEPAASLYESHPQALPGQTFEGRPILWARIPGDPHGKSLLFNGHYDTVPVAPRDQWTRSPAGEDVVDGRVYGRGACDMKGGIAAALAAAAGMVRSGLELPGDLYFNLVPFEEVNGMGTIATMLDGRRADAAIVPEPSRLRAIAACKGIMEMRIEVDGRSAHGELPQPHHSEGGGVSAIDKLTEVLLGIRRLNEQWRLAPRKQHPLLQPPMALATMVEAGDFWASWPASATATFDVTYLPTEVDEDGLGSRVRAEIEDQVAHVAATDDWLVDHPPRFSWLAEFPPAEVDADDPFVRLVVDVTGHAEGLGGLDTWADHVSLVKAGIPAVLLGPRKDKPHGPDESVLVADLERCIELYVDVALRWADAGETNATDPEGSRA